MADLTQTSLFVVASLCFLSDGVVADLCRDDTLFTTYKYCSYGCCGSYPYQRCCTTSVGLIVGGVCAAIAGLAILITIICCCVRRQGSRGQVVRNPGLPIATATVVSTNTSSQYPGPTYGQPMTTAGQTYQYPTAYGQPMGGVAPGQYPSNAYSQPMGGVAPGPYPGNDKNQPMAAQPMQPPPYETVQGAEQPYGYGNPAFNPATPDKS